jgi:ribonuclease VapC
MIVVDSSAALAILLNEPEKETFKNILASTDRNIMSAVNVHETACVLRARHGAQAVVRLLRFLADADIEIIPFDKAQLIAARMRLIVMAKASIQRLDSTCPTARLMRFPKS